jgi:hypothetical protein
VPGGVIAGFAAARRIRQAGGTPVAFEAEDRGRGSRFHAGDRILRQFTLTRKCAA